MGFSCNSTYDLTALSLLICCDACMKQLRRISGDLHVVGDHVDSVRFMQLCVSARGQGLGTIQKSYHICKL